MDDALTAVSARLWMFDALWPPLSDLRHWLSSADPARALAAAHALKRRLAEGCDDLAALVACVPGDIFALAPEVLGTVAELAIAGLPIAIPKLPPDLPPDLARSFRCAELLASPVLLPLDRASSLDLGAVSLAPIERAISSGLLRRVARHARPAMQDAAIEGVRSGLMLALLSPADAQEVLVLIARTSPPAVASRALTLLAEPWSVGLPCPPLGLWERGESAVAAVGVASARGERRWLRQMASDSSVPRSARRAALAALGGLGTPDDVEGLLAAAEEDAVGLGPEAIEALRGMKRRGASLDECGARRVVAVFFRCEAISLEAVAESVSSRADALLETIEEHLALGASQAKAIRLLEALGTRRAIARLVFMVDDAGLSGSAIRALGRLEERAAETVILARLEADPEACLGALARIGSAETVRSLRAALHRNTPPAWLAEGLRVLLRLDPSPEHVAAAVEHGAISSEVLEALPAYASAAQTGVLADIAAVPGHPFREAAIRALGRTGGPLAVDALGALLTDPSEAVREQSKGALSVLGERLAGPEPSLACLEDAPGKGAAMVAEAALRRLRLGVASSSEVTLLLDVVVGCKHPHLVRVVRPYLRRQDPEIKKRAIACLAAAGSASASWLLPHLDDSDVRVARQALLAVGAASVPGLGATVAAWLAHPNMNLKKVAAEALGTNRDTSVIPAIVALLAHNDQPGLRALLEAALRVTANDFFRSPLVEALAAASEAHGADLLASTLAGAFSPEDLASLVAARPDLPKALLHHAYASDAGQLAGKLTELDAALSRRGAAGSIPHESDVPRDSPLAAGLARVETGRRVLALRRHLREAPLGVVPELAACIRAVAGGPVHVELSVVEQRALVVLLPDLDAITRADAVAILAAAPDRALRQRLLRYVDLDGELDRRHAPLFAEALRLRGPAAARSLSQDPRPELRLAALNVLALSGEVAMAHTSRSERDAMVKALVNAGRDDSDEMLAAVEGPKTLASVVAVVAERLGAARALSFAERWVVVAPSERRAALVELDFLGEVIEPALRELVEGDGNGEVRVRAMGALRRARALAPTFLRPLLNDEHPAVREDAGRALFCLGDWDDRRRVLEAWLSGAFRGDFRMPLDEQDLAAVESAMVRAVVEADELRLLGPVEALPAYRRASLLLSMRRSSHARVSAAARDALRAMPALKVLPAIEAQLRAGDLSLLDVVGAAGAVPSVLAEIAQTSKESAPWVRFCLRVAGASVLFAAGLAPRIASWTAEDPSPQALSLLSRLSDWCDAAHAKALLGPLAPALAGARREAFLDAILGALREQPAMLVVPVLSWMAKPSDARVVRALAEAEAASPGIADLLEPALRSAVRRALRTALESAGPEQARKLLSYFANRVEQPAERSDVVELLARYVGSPSRRVSLHAHRLLRVTAPRERYLRATRALLDDTDPTTVRLALRVLSFGGDADSTAEIAEKLFHPHDAVARAAREGLLALGTRAVGPLQKARARARPDRRAAIDAVLEEIRAKEA